MVKLQKAATLADIYNTVSPEPLLTEQELEAFYGSEIIELRGSAVISRIKTRLLHSNVERPFKGYFMGHSGVGKSSALTRLKYDIKDRFQTIRFSAVECLDFVNFKAFDVLLLTITTLVEQCAKPIKEGGTGKKIANNLVRPLWDWFATTEISKTEEYTLNGGIGAGIDTGGTIWEKFLALKAKVTAEAKYAGARKKETVEYRLNNITDLIRVSNEIIDACQKTLVEKTKKQWLIFWEDFDKEGVPKESLRQLFLDYGHVFNDLNIHMVINIPVILGYSGDAQGAFSKAPRYLLHDSPVFDKEHKPHEEGRKALLDVVEKRMDIKLFDKDVLDLMLVASGGNLRDLFYMILEATDLAIGEELDSIGPTHAQSAKVTQRVEYERRLGTDSFDDDENPIGFKDKIERLKAIYHSKQDSSSTDNILYALLRSRAVQEFNGERWFGVHPLVVDYLVRNGHIEEPATGGPFGGTI